MDIIDGRKSGSRKSDDFENSVSNNSHSRKTQENFEALLDIQNLKNPYLKDKKWSNMSHKERFFKIAKIFAYICLIFTLIVIFFSSVGLLSTGFKIITAKHTRNIFKFAENPLAGLCLGIVSTVVFQSSSTTTSITVSLVASGALPVSSAVGLIMGANIGTSITNTLVSLGHVDNITEFRKAIQGATVHDFFNIFLVLIFLPLEQISFVDNMGFLEMLSYYMLKPLMNKDINLNSDKYNVFKIITKPISQLFLKKNSCAVSLFNKHHFSGNNATAFFKLCTDKCPQICSSSTTKCSQCALDKISFLSKGILKYSKFSDTASAAIGIVLSLVFMTGSLILVAKVLSRILKKNTAGWIKKALLSNAVVSILLGMAITFMVQSSSITTSSLVPLVAMDVITLQQMFPVTLGANVGTTITALLASLSEGEVYGIQIALCHLMFNVLGIVILYPIPYFRSLPIVCAEALGYKVSKNRLYGLAYIILTFFLVPLTLLGLSFAKGGAIAGVVLVYSALMFVFIWRQIRIRFPHLIPLWCPGCIKPNHREEDEAREDSQRIVGNLI